MLVQDDSLGVRSDNVERGKLVAEIMSTILKLGSLAIGRKLVL